MITSLTSNTTDTTSTTTTNSSNNTDITTEDFIAIMIEELSNQDPTDPEDTSAYIEQLTTLQNMEAIEDQTEALENMSDEIEYMSELMYSMTYESSFQNACELIGSEVSGETSTGTEVSGTVSSVEVDGNDISLVLSNGSSIDYYSLSEVS